MNISKIFKVFLIPTARAEKVPTDIELDNKIEYVSQLLHHLSPLLKQIVYTKIKLFFLYRWKFLFIRILLVGIVITLSYLLLITMTDVKLTTKNEKIKILTYKDDSTMNLRNFLLQIAYVESRYNPKAHRDSSQYWGIYQLGTEARKTGGYGDVSMEVFFNHPELQDLCMINFLKKNKKMLIPYIKKYNGKVVDGILVTESGIVALSHIGVGYAKKYLDEGVVPEIDENGNHPRAYLKLGGYKLNLEKVKYSIEDGN